MSSSQPTTAHVAALLEAYHAGALDSAEAAQVERHLSACAACQEQSEQIALYQIIRAAPAPTVGPELRDGLYARIAAASAPALEHRRASLRHARRPLASRMAHPGGGHAAPGWLSGAVALVVVALLASMFWALPRLSMRNLHGGASSIAPASPIPSVAAACPASATSATIPKDTYLADIALTGPTEGWAVGGIINTQAVTTEGIILRFHQCHWASIALSLPNIGLTNISMDSATDGWAVGSHADTNEPILLHYTHGSWSQALMAPLPSGLLVAESYFAQVRAAGPDNIWITAFTPKTSQGQTSPMLLLHLVNGAWESVASPLPILYTVAPVGPNDLWIVGGTSTTSASADTYRFAHYQNGQWSVMRQPAGAELTTLHAISPSDIWASGYIPNLTSQDPTISLPIVAHYDGASWQIAPQAVPPGAGAGVMSYALGDGAGWAERTSSLTPTAHQSSTFVVSAVWSESSGQWSSAPWPYKDLNSVWAWAPVSSVEFWALASYPVEVLTPDGSGSYSGLGFSRGVLLHYADGAWSRYG